MEGSYILLGLFIFQMPSLEVAEQHSTKLCLLFGSESELKMC